MLKRLHERTLSALLYGILLTPFFFARSFMHPFIAPKTFLFQALVEIAFALWLGLIIFYKEYRPRFTPLFRAVFIFLIVLTFVSYFGIDLERSLWSSQARGTGLVLMYHFAALFLMLTSFGSKIGWKNYLSVSFAASTVVAAFALVQQAVPQFFLDQAAGRAGSFLGNPSYLAAYLLFHIGLGIWLFFYTKREPGRWGTLSKFFLIGAIFEFGIMLLTGTRGAVLGFGAGVLSVLVYALTLSGEVPRALRRFGSTYRVLAERSLLAILGLGLFFGITGSTGVWKKIPTLDRLIDLSSAYNQVQPRLLAWKSGLRGFMDRPLLGFGFENFKYPFDKHYDPRLLRYTFGETYFDKPHNVFIEYLTTGGVLGFLSYVGLLGAAFYELKRTKRDIAFPIFLATLVSYVVQNLFFFDTFGSYLPFFILLAFLDYRYKAEPALELPPVAETRNKVVVKGVALAALFLISLMPVYLLNWKALYANNRQYWGLNYFLNQQSVNAIDSYVEALTTKHPYIDEVRRDFAQAVSDMFSAGVSIPDIQKVATKAMGELALALNNHPNDFLYRVQFMENAAVLYIFEPAFLQLAEEQAEQALKISPKRQRVYYAHAKVKILEGKKTDAFNLMKKAVDLDPLAGDPHFFYGLLAFETGDTKLGFEEIDRAQELGRIPKTIGEARILAGHYAEAERYEEAISLYEQVVRITPTNWGYNIENSRFEPDFDSLLKLAILYHYVGKDDLAREYIRNVMEHVNLAESPFYSVLKPILDELGL